MLGIETSIASSIPPKAMALAEKPTSSVDSHRVYLLVGSPRWRTEYATANFRRRSGPIRCWLAKKYYFLRAGASASWIALALLVGKSGPPVAAILLVAYPAWDAVANVLDAQKSGGLRSNLSQALNVAVSVLTALGVLYALGMGMKLVLIVFGAWALFAGIFQLLTGVRRWKAGGQWVMILSGGQSALVSIHFFKNAQASPPPGVEAIVPYAALGAIYFLVSAIWLTVKAARQRPTRAST